jgi:hypothetical protein
MIRVILLLPSLLGSVACFTLELIWDGSYRHLVGLLGRVISPTARLLPAKYNSTKKFHPGVIKFRITLQQWKKIQHILLWAPNIKFH